MLRNYFLPGFAMVFLGLFTFSRPPATPVPTGRDSGKQPATVAAGEMKSPVIQSATPALQSPQIESDKPLWDREAVGKRARYEMNEKLKEYSLDDPCILHVLGIIRKCLPSDPNAPPAEAMIALVPNPTHTHLALMFDREIDAIQQALQDETSQNSGSWIYTNQWLPWDLVPYQASQEPIARTNARTFDVGREIAPGVLIFRRNEFQGRFPTEQHSKFLLVYLVGESPTAGVNREQFINAVTECQRIEKRDPDAISGKGSTLRILGPNFSTSLLSLDHLLKISLDHLLRTEFCRASQPVGRQAGTPTSCIQSAQVISGQISADPQDTSGLPELRKAGFFSLTESARTSQGMLLNYLSGVEEIPRRSIALLSEDQTAFGGFSTEDAEQDSRTSQHACPRDKGEPLILHFPREISQLRNAYEKNSILKTSSANQNPNAARQSLALNMDDIHDQEDDVPSFSDNQEAISEESVLSAVTREMYNRQIRVVVISATDVLDTIFVTQFLKRNLPNVRIVVLDDADLIFARPGQAHNFRGTLIVTPYPLIGNSVDWGGRFLASAGHGRVDPYGTLLPDRVFPTPEAVGAYNAMRLLEMGPLDIQRDKHDRVSFITDSNGKPLPLWLFGYTDPFRRGNRPPLWLSTVGRGGFWPVALLDRVKDAPPSSLPQIFANKDVRPQPNPEETIPPGMFKPASRSRITALCILLFFVLAGAFFCASTKLDQYSFGIPGTNSKRRAWIVLGIILCYSWIARFLMLDFSPETFRGDAVSRWMLGIQIFLLVFALWLIRRALNKTWHPWAAAALLLFTAALQIGFHYVRPAEFAGRVFYYYRAEHLFSEVSPVLPFIFLFAALIAVISRHVQALFVFSPALRPCVPTSPAENKPIIPAKNSDWILLPSSKDVKNIFQACYSPWRLPRTDIAPAGWVSTLAVAAITGIVFRLLFRHGFDTMESHAYTGYLTVFAAFITFMLLYEVFWCFIIWIYLRNKLLLPLERTPLRACFSRVSGFSWRRLWLDLDLSRKARNKALLRACESLSRITQNPKCPSYAAETANTVDVARAEILSHTDNASAFMQMFKNYSEKLCACACAVISSILSDPRYQEPLSTSFDAPAETRRKLLDQIASDDPLRASAEEFVGLIYIHAIQHVLVDIRSHVFAFAFGYFFLLLALDVYPVGPHHTIMLLLLGLFLAFFVAVAWMFQQMSRDSILSRTTDTELGKLDPAFYLHIATALAVPLLGLIASQFPEISNFLYSWLQPSLQAIK